MLTLIAGKNSALIDTQNLNNRNGRKALSRFRELSGSITQISDFHCFEIHRTLSQSSAVPRSLLKTTLAYDYICLGIRLDFVGQIWGNLSAKPCPSMPIRPLRGYSRPRFNKLLRKRKAVLWQHTDSESQHNRGMGGGCIHGDILPCRRHVPNSVCNLMPRRLVCISVY